MGYLDNSSITVDAVLTKKGREILKNGGNLNITNFTLSDTGADYRLWNPTHPSGSGFYGEAIENLPMLEASVHAEYNLSNRLISLTQDSVAIPALIVSGLDSKDNRVLTLQDGATSKTITIDVVGYGGDLKPDVGSDFYIVVQNPLIVNAGKGGKGISGTSRQFVEAASIPFAKQYDVGRTFRLSAEQLETAGQETIVTVVSRKLGAFDSFRVVNNVTRQERAILASRIQR